MSDGKTTITVDEELSDIVGKIQDLENLGSKENALRLVLNQSKYNKTSPVEIIEEEFEDIIKRIPDKKVEENDTEITILKQLLKQVVRGKINDKDYKRIFDKKEYKKELKKEYDQDKNRNLSDQDQKILNAKPEE